MGLKDYAELIKTVTMPGIAEAVKVELTVHFETDKPVPHMRHNVKFEYFNDRFGDKVESSDN